MQSLLTDIPQVSLPKSAGIKASSGSSIQILGAALVYGATNGAGRSAGTKQKHTKGMASWHKLLNILRKVELRQPGGSLTQWSLGGVRTKRGATLPETLRNGVYIKGRCPIGRVPGTCGDEHQRDPLLEQSLSHCCIENEAVAGGGPFPSRFWRAQRSLMDWLDLSSRAHSRRRGEGETLQAASVVVNWVKERRRSGMKAP